MRSRSTFGVDIALFTVKFGQNVRKSTVCYPLPVLPQLMKWRQSARAVSGGLIDQSYFVSVAEVSRYHAHHFAQDDDQNKPHMANKGQIQNL